ncbi:hypothetical protein M422DRAFT_273051 [Sphaerobolus stellatus SS14]|uniref:Uncharacterized protein n=1 Tax=Sphaerobolus stellatus (strain SS14) TaxID=990650 RepID=A0A0C9TA91_SPHS4|nr:hypothetical protein M422DRAFT_273051 [Sphaerobolus stellatus SS14]
MRKHGTGYNISAEDVPESSMRKHGTGYNISDRKRPTLPTDGINYYAAKELLALAILAILVAWPTES